MVYTEDEWHNYIFKLFLILASLGYRMNKFSFSDVCSTKGITPGGGPAVANSRLKRGCTNTCQPTTIKPEVHVIAQTKAMGYVDSYENPKVETLRASDHCVYVCAHICVCVYIYIVAFVDALNPNTATNHPLFERQDRCSIFSVLCYFRYVVRE